MCVDQNLYLLCGGWVVNMSVKMSLSSFSRFITATDNGLAVVWSAEVSLIVGGIESLPP